MNIKTKIMLDSANLEDTKKAIELLGQLDGQTTNPTLVSRNPEVQEKISAGKKFTLEELLAFYKQEVQKISSLIPDGSVSIEVYADKNTTAEEMFNQGKEMFSWIPNAQIKFPTTKEGLKAAHTAIQEKMRVNMTLVFNQEQGAAVYVATKGARKGDVYLSPFVGRLDDLGVNGMSLIENTLKMYEKGDGHVEILVSSVRNMDHFLSSLALGADRITVPLNIIEEWAQDDLKAPGSDYVYNAVNLKNIAFKKLDLTKDYLELFKDHELLEKGLERFAEDWNALIKS